MSIPQYKLDDRNFYLSKAQFHASRQRGFQSAVFFIESFNEWIRYQPREETPPPITPQEVFGNIDQAAYSAAKTAVEHLRNTTGYVCEPSAGTIEQRRLRMGFENPGFEEECYERAEAHSQQEMR